MSILERGRAQDTGVGEDKEKRSETKIFGCTISYKNIKILLQFVSLAAAPANTACNIFQHRTGRG